MTTRRRQRHSLASLHRTSTSRVHMTMASAGAVASRLPRRAAAHFSLGWGGDQGNHHHAYLGRRNLDEVRDPARANPLNMEANFGSSMRTPSFASAFADKTMAMAPPAGPDWPTSPPSTQAGDLALASPVNRRAAHRRSSSAEPCRWLDARTCPRRAEIRRRLVRRELRWLEWVDMMGCRWSSDC